MPESWHGPCHIMPPNFPKTPEGWHDPCQKCTAVRSTLRKMSIFFSKHVICWYVNYLSSTFDRKCNSLLVDCTWVIWWSCLRSQVVRRCLRSLSSKLWVHCILIMLRAYVMGVFTLLRWGLMPCELLLFMLRAYALWVYLCSYVGGSCPGWYHMHISC